MLSVCEMALLTTMLFVVWGGGGGALLVFSYFLLRTVDLSFSLSLSFLSFSVEMGG